MKSNAMKVLMPAFVVSIMLAAGFAAVLVPAGDSDGVAAPAEEYDVVWKLRNVTVADEEKVDKVGYSFSFTPICNEGYKDMTVTIKINGVVATEGSYVCGFGPYHYYCEGETYNVYGVDGPVTVIATARSMTTVISPPAAPVEKYYSVYTVSDPDYIKMAGIPANAKVRENAPLNVSISQASIPVKVNVTVTMGGKVLNDAFTYANGSESSGTVFIGAVVGDVEISVAYEVVSAEGPAAENAGFPWWIVIVAIIGVALLGVYVRSKRNEQAI